MKKCSRCGEEKPLTAYYFETRRGKKTPRGKCKTCHKAAVYARRAENPERTKEVDARYRKKNRDKRIAKQREWWAQNGDAHNAARRQARRENPERFRALERAWLEANRERNRESQREWYTANRDRARKWRREHRAANPELHKKWARDSRKRHPEKVKARHDAWRKKNREHIRQYKREYYKRRPEVTLDVQQRRRAIKRGVRSEKFSRVEIYERDQGVCQHCGAWCHPKGWELDHIIPMRLGGPHTRRNTRVLCAPCNLRKGGKLDVLCKHLPTRLLLPQTTGQ